MNRSGPIRRRGRSRFPKRRDAPEGYFDFVRSRWCLAGVREVGGALVGAEGCFGPHQVAHVKSRGAGGPDFGNVVSLCLAHHYEEHTIGRKSFEARYGLDLKTAAANIASQWGEWTAMQDRAA